MAPVYSIAMSLSHLSISFLDIINSSSHVSAGTDTPTDGDLGPVMCMASMGLA
jgi:hypothetical protein